MIVFAFDRDHPVDVNPPPKKKPVPLAWVRYLAHETEHEVWAIGNQRLRREAGIPGIAELKKQIEKDPDVEREGPPVGRPPRRERLRLLQVLFSEADGYVVVDEVNLEDVEGWRHYFPWDFARRDHPEEWA